MNRFAILAAMGSLGFAAQAMALPGLTDTTHSGVNGADWTSVAGGPVSGSGIAAAIDVNGTNGLGVYCTGCGDDYTGYFIPAQTGLYTFAMASDDAGSVRLSTDSSPANLATIISQQNDWTGFRQYNSESNGSAANNFSAPIPLVAGQAYYIEAVSAQGGGGMNYSVAAAFNSTVIPDGTPGLGDPSQNGIGTLSTTIPEPATVGLALLGMGGLVLRRRAR